jgi:hypothetical protein
MRIVSEAECWLKGSQRRRGGGGGEFGKGKMERGVGEAAK